MGIARAHGQAGESLAAAYLALAGCEVRARNTRLAGVEVDLVAADGRTEVIVEVKYRARADFGGAALAVDAAKRARLLRAASALAAAGRAVRVDVVAIELRDDGLVLRHYRNALEDDR
jgi:putative endonuclease